MKPYDRRTLPTDVYLSFVSSLFQHRQTLLIGMISHVILFLLVYSKTQDVVYLLSAVSIFLVWLLRIAGMRRFDQVDPASLDSAAIYRWEMHYNLRAALVTFTLGAACGYSILVTRDPFAELATISVTLGTMVSVVGRNYGSPIAIRLLSYTACGPIVFGLLFLFDGYMALLAVLMLPYIVTIGTMATGVREFLYRNVLAAREIATIAGRFDTALNTMTHGLFLLDSENRILVANRKACELLNIGDEEKWKDCHLDVVLRYGMQHSFLAHEQATQVLRQLTQLINGAQSRTLVSLSDDLFLEFSASRRDGGGIVLIFEDVTPRIVAERKILQMVRFDTLTGLPNRDYFSELLQNALLERKREGQVGFMVLDIVEFKHVNDTRGHVVGDSLIAEVANRIRTLSSGRAIAARLMGDEFVLFFPNEANRRDLEERMRQLHSQLRGNYAASGFTFDVALSAGYVISSSAEFRLEDQQIKADLALFETKSRAKGSCTAFETRMDADYLDRQRLKADLRIAVQEGALSVAYQPMFTPDGARIECCEALARWVHRERGPVPPDMFIRLAEELGIVSDITRFMIAQACRDCLTWPDPIGVSVNLSVLDLRNPGFVALVWDILAETGLHASRLHLEVTESCLMEEPVKVQTMLQELRAHGITISIDDFGTGYSSLSYLDQLPLDVIKIDRAFVRNIGEDARRFSLLRGTVNLSRALGLKIVIEGVETIDQLELINKYDCADLVQGYVFAAPMPSSQIAARAAAGNRKTVSALRIAGGSH